MRKVMEPERWFRDGPVQALLDGGQAPADVLTELETDGNTLSVWLLESAEHAPRVLALLELHKCKAHPGNQKGKSFKDDARFFTFAEEIPAGLGIALVASPGPTADATTNGQHRDLVDLTASKVAELALELMKVAEPVTVPVEDLLAELRQAEHDGRVAATSVPPSVRDQLNKTAPPPAS